MKIREKGVSAADVVKIGQDLDRFDLEEEESLDKGEEEDVVGHVRRLGRLAVESQLDQRRVTLGRVPARIRLSVKTADLCEGMQM